MVRSPGFEPGSSAWEADSKAQTLNWGRSKPEFTEYIRSKRFNARYERDILTNLDKYVVTIRSPMDVIRIFSKLTAGQAHNLNRALRNFLNFYELKGVNTDYLNSLRKAIPQDTRGYDLNVPDENQIINSFKTLNRAPLKYRCLWNLLLDSGLRLTEACRLINTFDGAVNVGDFYRVTLGYFRGAKLAFAGYFTEYTYQLIKRNSEKIAEGNASHYYNKYEYVAPKYCRKFVFGTLISERFNVPESVADFIEGRTPKKVGARHYAKLLRQADGYYPKYAHYLDELRGKIMNCG
jgi:intergrase/recombinase